MAIADELLFHTPSSGFSEASASLRVLKQLMDAGSKAVRMAYTASHLWNASEKPRRGRCDHEGIDAARKRRHHVGQVHPSHDASQAGSTIAHRGKHSVPKRSHAVDDQGCKCLNRKSWALNSAVECHLHTVEVIGSNPIAPTNFLFSFQHVPEVRGSTREHGSASSRRTISTILLCALKSIKTDELPELRYSTQLAYSSYLGTHILPKWGDYPLEAIKPLAVEQWTALLNPSLLAGFGMRQACH